MRPREVSAVAAIIRSLIATAPWTQPTGRAPRREKLVSLRLLGASEFRDWLIHVKNRYSRPTSRDEDKIALAESALKAVNMGLRAVRPELTTGAARQARS